MGFFSLAVSLALAWSFFVLFAFLAAFRAFSVARAASSASVLRWSGTSFAVASAASLATSGKTLNGDVGYWNCPNALVAAETGVR